MKKIMTGCMFLAIALFMCSGFIAAPAMAVEGVINCRVDADCDNGLGDFCTSIPTCQVGGKPCEDEECDGVCTFIDPCAKYSKTPVCDQNSQFDDERACVGCVIDEDCRGSDHMCDKDDSDGPKIMYRGACIDNECIECRDDDDCNAPVDVCNPQPRNFECLDGACIECVEDAECPNGTLCRNNFCCGSPVQNECNPSENDSENVARPGLNPNCKQADDSDYCSQYGTCLTDGTCDNESNRCKPLGQFCVVQDVTDGECAWCLNNSDCADWECDTYPEGYPNAGQYIEETSGPICNGFTDCRDCRINSDCDAKETFCTGPWHCTEEFGCVPDNATYNPCSAQDEKTVCDDVLDKCVVCTPDDLTNCESDDLVFCNETITCKNNVCAYGNTCPSGECHSEVSKCYDCEDDNDCTEALFPGKGVCVIGQEDVPGTDNETNYCAQCQVDDDCSPGVCELNDPDDPRDNTCLECRVDNDCEGTDVCLNNKCVECSGDDCPCPDGTYCLENNPFPNCVLPKDFELNVCVECTEDSDCPDAGVCDLGDCPECKPIGAKGDQCGALAACKTDWDCGENAVCTTEYCGGESFCCEKQEATLRNECVECLDDSDCDERLDRLDDPLAACKVDAVCDNNTNTCSYSNPCGELECYPAGYYNSEDFGKVTDCEGDDCPTFDYYCANCSSQQDCMDNMYCNGVESCTKNGCVAGTSPCAEGLLCDEATDSCLVVDCITNDDCMFFETCNDQNECIEKDPTCGLKINPKQMQANKLFAAEGFTFKIQAIKGQTGFDPNAPKYFGEQIDEIQSVVKKGKLKTQVKGDTANPINPGTLEIWVGNCQGTVVLK